MKPSGDIDKAINCTRCDGRFTVRQLINNIFGCYSSLPVAKSKTPCCQQEEDIGLSNGLALRGQLTNNNQQHFSDSEQYEAPDMEVEYKTNSILIQTEDYVKIISRNL